MTDIPTWAWVLTILITATSFLLVAAAIFVRTIHAILNSKPDSGRPNSTEQPQKNVIEKTSQLLEEAEALALARLGKLNRQPPTWKMSGPASMFQPKQIKKRL